MRTSKRIRVDDYRELCRKAWDYLWADRRLDSSDDRFNEHYFTATDVHRRVRAHARELLEGLPYGSAGRDCHDERVRCSVTLEKVRRWLVDQVRSGRLRADSPTQRGTVTGLRFRPVDMGLTFAEERTAEAKAKAEERGPIVHVRAADGKTPLCAPEKKPARRSFYSAHRRKYPRFVSEYNPEPTCKRCLAKLAKAKAEAPIP